ncbi:hypothetical protein DFP72DRAFT_1091610 [Ephemerocybe angulata]|uniref:Uncharacterized protein n=1 Tax=Ephemerocybe angulata TaxID=980116 RepID=A0A8H6LVB1_9AGAR|nr:hypothetical protein DFP72DRAFT_1091610 [Tulosesus angulatus]
MSSITTKYLTVPQDNITHPPLAPSESDTITKRFNVPQDRLVPNTTDRSDTGITHPFEHRGCFPFSKTTRALHFEVKGRHTRGRVQVTTSTDPDAEDIVIALKSRFRQECLIDDIFGAGLIDDNDNENGLSLQMKANAPYDLNDFAFQDINIIFPAPKGSALTSFPSLTIDLEGRHEVLLKQGSSIAFENLTIRVSNGNILARPAYVNDGSLVTQKGWIRGLFHSNENLSVRADGHICGTFVSEGSLSITTDNGPIDVDITSNHLNSSTVNDISVQSANGTHTTILHASTLNADIFLTSPLPNPTYTLTTATTLGALYAKIHDMPSDASLTFSGTVSQAADECGLALPQYFQSGDRPYEVVYRRDGRGIVIRTGAGAGVGEEGEEDGVGGVEGRLGGLVLEGDGRGVSPGI